jgi:hypothetical protein
MYPSRVQLSSGKGKWKGAIRSKLVCHAINSTCNFPWVHNGINLRETLLAQQTKQDFKMHNYLPLAHIKRIMKSLKMCE